MMSSLHEWKIMEILDKFLFLDERSVMDLFVCSYYVALGESFDGQGIRENL